MTPACRTTRSPSSVPAPTWHSGPTLAPAPMRAPGSTTALACTPIGGGGSGRRKATTTREKARLGSWQRSRARSARREERSKGTITAPARVFSSSPACRALRTKLTWSERASSSAAGPTRTRAPSPSRTASQSSASSDAVRWIMVGRRLERAPGFPTVRKRPGTELECLLPSLAESTARDAVSRSRASAHIIRGRAPGPLRVGGNPSRTSRGGAGGQSSESDLELEHLGVVAVALAQREAEAEGERHGERDAEQEAGRDAQLFEVERELVRIEDAEVQEDAALDGLDLAIGARLDVLHERAAILQRAVEGGRAPDGETVLVRSDAT